MPSASGAAVDVEHATDAQFQTWIDANGLSGYVEDGGIAAWSFDDRIRIINFALRSGLPLNFAGENNSNNSENNSDSELLESGETSSQAV